MSEKIFYSVNVVNKICFKYSKSHIVCMFDSSHNSFECCLQTTPSSFLAVFRRFSFAPVFSGVASQPRDTQYRNTLFLSSPIFIYHRSYHMIIH